MNKCSGRTLKSISRKTEGETTRDLEQSARLIQQADYRLVSFLSHKSAQLTVELVRSLQTLETEGMQMLHDALGVVGGRCSPESESSLCLLTLVPLEFIVTTPRSVDTFTTLRSADTFTPLRSADTFFNASRSDDTLFNTPSSGVNFSTTPCSADTLFTPCCSVVSFSTAPRSADAFTRAEFLHREV